MAGDLFTLRTALDTIEISPQELPYLREDFRQILLDRSLLGIDTSPPRMTYIQPLSGARCFLKPIPSGPEDRLVIQCMEHLFRHLTEKHLPEEWSLESKGTGKVSWNLVNDFITIHAVENFSIVLPPAFSNLPVQSSILCGGSLASQQPKELST